MTTFTTLRGKTLRRFVRHYLEMIAAMVVGMIVLGSLESVLLNPIGWAELRSYPEMHVLIMATNMTVAMGSWMRFRSHRWATIGEMALAMYVPFLLLFPPLWLGVLSADGLMGIGHVLMLLAMVVVMLRRREEFTDHQHQADSVPQPRVSPHKAMDEGRV
jgi:hypothetical protein